MDHEKSSFFPTTQKQIYLKRPILPIPQNFFKILEDILFYLHIEGESYLRQMNLNEVVFSDILKSYNKQTLTLLKQFSQEYVVLPGYVEQEKSIDGKIVLRLTDIQLAVTGRFKKGQSPQQSTKRQLKQEIGVSAPAQKIKGVGANGQLVGVQGSGELSNKIVYPSIIQLSDYQTQMIQENQIEEKDKREDDNRFSIQSWLLISEINDVILKRKRRSQDRIGEVIAIIKVKDMKKIIKQFLRTVGINEMIYENQKDQKIKNKETIDSQKKMAAFLSNKSNRISADRNKVAEYCQTKEGSLKNQQLLKAMNYNQIDRFIDDIEYAVCQLASDWYGNHVIQVLFKKSNQDQRIRLLKIMIPKLLKIACTKQGTYTWQRIVEYIKTESEFQVILPGIVHNFVKLAKDNNANYFLRKVIQIFPFSELQNLQQSFIQNLKNFKDLLCDVNGVCVMKELMKRIVQSSSKDNKRGTQMKKNIIESLKVCFYDVIESPGSYFIHQAYQIFIQTPAQMQPITQLFFQKFKYLCLQQNSNKVLCECIENYWAKPYYNDFYFKLGNDISADDIREILNDSKGNWVLRRIFRIKGEFELKNKIAKQVVEVTMPKNFTNEDLKRWSEVIERYKKGHHKVGDQWVLK